MNPVLSVIPAILNVIYIILAIGLVIVFHEFGHYIVAKRHGIFVEKFSLGFGPVILRIKRETEFLISLIPFGGYVKMKGEHPFEERKFTGDEFFSKTPLQRSFVVIAGPLANFVLGFIIFFFTFWLGGVLIPQNKPVVGRVVKDSPADKAGLKKSDIILTVDGKVLKTWDDLVGTVHPNAGKELNFEISRNGKKFQRKITPKESIGSGIGLIGIEVFYTREFIPPWKALALSAGKCALIIYTTLKYLYLAVTGKVAADIAGPIGIAAMMNDTLKQGWVMFLNLVAGLSLSLGLINLFPIPLLDGGHIAIFAWEGIRKKFPSQKVYNVIQTVGLAVILFLIIFASRNDILRLLTK
ncbi:MAG: RIP metalloprotease RseP [bacterium]